MLLQVVISRCCNGLEQMAASGMQTHVPTLLEEDICGRCGEGAFTAHRGIEVGHVFFLGTKYSAPMKCNFLDDKGTERPMVMGCYGIGVGRTVAAAIEQNHDADGIVCLPHEEVSEIAERAAERRLLEGRALELIRRGALPLEALKAAR